MPNDELAKYVVEAKKAGTSDERIKQALLTAGWQGQDIDEALKVNNAANLPSVHQVASQPIVRPKRKFSKILIVSLVAVLVLASGYFVLAKYVLRRTAPNNPGAVTPPSPTPAPSPAQATAVQSVLAKSTVKKLGTYPNGGCVFSPDHTRSACWEMKDKQQRNVIDGHPEAWYSRVELQGVKFSEDGQHYAYSAQKEGGWVMVLDGKEGKQYDRVSDPGFSPDGSKFYYRAFQGQDYIVVVNDAESKKYNEVWSEGFITFSPDSKHWAYMVRQLKQWYVVLDGKEGEANYWIPESLTFSPDSNHLAYIGKVKNGVSTGQAVNFKYVFVLDDKKGPAYDLVRNILFSADGSQYAYVAESSGRGFVVLNGKEISPDLGGNHGHISQAFSPDGKQFAYVAESGGKYFAILNGKEGTPYDLATNLMFSPDGKKFAYIAIKNNKSFFVVNGLEGKAYDGVSMPVFSPDNNHLAYIADVSSKQPLVLNEQQIALYKTYYPGKELPTSTMEVKKFFVVLDDKEGKQYDFLGSPGYSILPVQFSPDSQRVIYVASASSTAFVVINDKEGEAYDYIETYFSQDTHAYTTFKFNQSGDTVTYVAMKRIQCKDFMCKQKDLYQVEQPL